MSPCQMISGTLSAKLSRARANEAHRLRVLLAEAHRTVVGRRTEWEEDPCGDGWLLGWSGLLGRRRRRRTRHLLLVRCLLLQDSDQIQQQIVSVRGRVGGEEGEERCYIQAKGLPQRETQSRLGSAPRRTQNHPTHPHRNGKEVLDHSNIRVAPPLVGDTSDRCGRH